VSLESLSEWKQVLGARGAYNQGRGALTGRGAHAASPPLKDCTSTTHTKRAAHTVQRPRNGAKPLQTLGKAIKLRGKPYDITSSSNFVKDMVFVKRSNVTQNA